MAHGSKYKDRSYRMSRPKTTRQFLWNLIFSREGLFVYTTLFIGVGTGIYRYFYYEMKEIARREYLKQDDEKIKTIRNT